MRSSVIAVALGCLLLSSCAQEETLATLCRDLSGEVADIVESSETASELEAAQVELNATLDAISAAEDPGGWSDEELKDIEQCAASALDLHTELERRRR